jgi:hypothetical protein
VSPLVPQLLLEEQFGVIGVTGVVGVTHPEEEHVFPEVAQFSVYSFT